MTCLPRFPEERRKAGEGSGENLFESEAEVNVWLWFAAGFITAILYVHRAAR